MKLKKLTKQFLALFSCAAILAGSTVSALAEAPVQNIDPGQTGTLHITKYDITAAESAGKIQKDNTSGTRDTEAQSNFADYALQGVEFTYLKVADFTQQTVEATENPAAEASVKVVYTIPEALETALGMTNKNTEHTYSSDELNTALAGAVASVDRINALEAYVKSNGGTAMQKTDEYGYTSVENLPLGLYLVVETSVPASVKSTTNPFFVTLPMTNAQGTAWQYEIWIYPKNQTDKPTLSKQVKLVGEKENGTAETFAETTSADIGENVEYQIVSHLPAITSTATYLKEYTYTDKIEAGLVYDKSKAVEIKFYTDENLTSAAGMTSFEKDTDYTVIYDDTSRTMTIKMTEAGLAKLNPGFSQAYMAVTYQATVTSSAVLGDKGNLNEVVLSYGRTNVTDGGTGGDSGSTTPNNGDKGYIKDAAKVYTYGISLQKKFSDGNGDATKVTFTLTNSSTGKIIYAAAGQDGSYHVCAEGTEGAVTDFHPASNGSLQIRGLKEGKYELLETATASGYMLLKDKLVIQVNESSAEFATADGTDLTKLSVTAANETPATATVNDKTASMSSDGESNLASTNAFVDLAVTNNKGFELPKTGGLGTILFTMIGAAGLACCIILFSRKRRTEQ